MKKLLIICSMVILIFLTGCKKTEQTKKIKVVVDGSELVVSENEQLNSVNKPTKQEQAFDKWLVNGREVPTDYKLQDGDTLTATWRNFKFYTVKFINTIEEYQEQLIREDKLVTEPNKPIKMYYDFAGWYNGELKFDFTKFITSDITLTAKWDKIGAPKVKVKLDINGELQDFEGYYGEDLPSEVKNTDKGYFSHWAINDKKVENNYALNEGETIKAVFNNFPQLFYILYKNEILTDPSVNLLDSETYMKYHVETFNPHREYLKINNNAELSYNDYKDIIPKMEGYKIFAVIILGKPYGIDLKEVDGVIYTKIPPHTEKIEVMLVKE